MNKKTIRTIDGLLQKGIIKESDTDILRQVVENFSLAIPHQMLELINQNNPNDPNDPIAKQFVPDARELNISSNEREDPIGDETHTAVKGVIHRYRDRCLLTPVHVCPVYCRFCFRREKVGDSAATMTPAELEKAYTYINEHKEVWEVILTGGDPLILKPASLKEILTKLCAIDHVEVIRIHTRVPVVESERINADMISAFKCGKPVYIVLHANHPNEFTPAAEEACATIVDAGIPMLSQSILLQDLNDSIEVLSKLMRCFIKNRIKPYYLHHADLVRGTKHFRTSIAAGQALIKQLRGRFSGICQPTYVLDIPGGYGKVPIGPAYIHPQENPGMQQSEYLVEDYQGEMHHYF